MTTRLRSRGGCYSRSRNRRKNSPGTATTSCSSADATVSLAHLAASASACLTGSSPRASLGLWNFSAAGRARSVLSRSILYPAVPLDAMGTRLGEGVQQLAEHTSAIGILPTVGLRSLFAQPGQFQDSYDSSVSPDPPKAALTVRKAARAMAWRFSAAGSTCIYRPRRATDKSSTAVALLCYLSSPAISSRPTASVSTPQKEPVRSEASMSGVRVAVT